MSVWLDDGDLKILHGDTRDELTYLPDNSVDCIVTSPPYWTIIATLDYVTDRATAPSMTVTLDAEWADTA